MKAANVLALKVDRRSWHCDPDLGFQGLARASFDEPTAEKHTPPPNRVNLSFVGETGVPPGGRGNPPGRPFFGRRTSLSKGDDFRETPGQDQNRPTQAENGDSTYRDDTAPPGTRTPDPLILSIMSNYTEHFLTKALTSSPPRPSRQV